MLEVRIQWMDGSLDVGSFGSNEDGYAWKLRPGRTVYDDDCGNSHDCFALVVEATGVYKQYTDWCAWRYGDGRRRDGEEVYLMADCYDAESLGEYIEWLEQNVACIHVNGTLWLKGRRFGEPYDFVESTTRLLSEGLYDDDCGGDDDGSDDNDGDWQDEEALRRALDRYFEGGIDGLSTATLVDSVDKFRRSGGFMGHLIDILRDEGVEPWWDEE